MADDKRAGADEDKKYKRELAKWLVLVAVVVVYGALIWRDASRTSEIDAMIDALIENEEKMRAEVEEMAAKVEEVRERLARHRLAP